MIPSEEWLLQTCSARGFIPKAEIATVDLVGYLGD